MSRQPDHLDSGGESEDSSIQSEKPGPPAQPLVTTNHAMYQHDNLKAILLKETDKLLSRDRLRKAQEDDIVMVKFKADGTIGFVLVQWLFRDHDPIL